MELLAGMEPLYIGMGQLDGLLEVIGHQSPCLVHLLWRDCQSIHLYVVELLLIAQHSLITMLAHIVEHALDRSCQMSSIVCRPLQKGLQLAGGGIFVYVHFLFLPNG